MSRDQAVYISYETRPTAASDRMRAMSGMVPTICSVLATAVIMGAVQAEEIYPARPVRLVVGFGAGGPTDIPARFVAEKLGEALCCGRDDCDPRRAEQQGVAVPRLHAF